MGGNPLEGSAFTGAGLPWGPKGGGGTPLPNPKNMQSVIDLGQNTKSNMEKTLADLKMQDANRIAGENAATENTRMGNAQNAFTQSNDLENAMMMQRRKRVGQSMYGNMGGY